jgi:hypothetical protein
VHGLRLVHTHSADRVLSKWLLPEDAAHRADWQDRKLGPPDNSSRQQGTSESAFLRRLQCGAPAPQFLTTPLHCYFNSISFMSVCDMLFVWGGKGRWNASVLTQKAQVGKRVPLSCTSHRNSAAQVVGGL